MYIYVEWQTSESVADYRQHGQVLRDQRNVGVGGEMHAGIVGMRCEGVSGVKNEWTA